MLHINLQSVAAMLL